MRTAPVVFTTLALAAAGVLIGLPAAAPIPAAAQDHPDPAALFESRCANCHTVPDSAVRTDRAWLDQVRRTA